MSTSTSFNFSVSVGFFIKSYQQYILINLYSLNSLTIKQLNFEASQEPKNQTIKTGNSRKKFNCQRDLNLNSKNNIKGQTKLDLKNYILAENEGVGILKCLLNYKLYSLKNSLRMTAKNKSIQIFSEEEGEKVKTISSTAFHEGEIGGIRHLNQVRFSHYQENGHENPIPLFEQLLQAPEQISQKSEKCCFEKYIMVERGRNRKIKKVTNQPKHYFRKFINNYEKFIQGDRYTLEQRRSLKKVVHSLNFLSNSKSKKLTMRQLMKLLLPGSIIDEQVAKKNRQIFSYILKADFCQNSKQDNRLEHMIASKLYAIRCRSIKLALRNNIH